MHEYGICIEHETYKTGRVFVHQGECAVLIECIGKRDRCPQIDNSRRRQRSMQLLVGEMVRPERFELPTSWFVAMRSIQLSYGRT